MRFFFFGLRGKNKSFSAGVPLTYYHKHSASTSVNNLTVKFLETPFTGNDDYTYRKNGFLPNITLTEIFSNKYTNISRERLQVRAMKAEDICNVTGLPEMIFGSAMNLADTIYDKLFANGAEYWLTSACNNSTSQLWFVHTNGYVNSGGNFEVRNSPSCFFKLPGKI